jgi:uncharacterized OsmC-like protein
VSSEQTQIEVELHWQEKMKVLTRVRDFNAILMDDKKMGEHVGPSPVEYFLSSIGSCMIMSFIYCLSLSRIHLNPDDFRVLVVGTLGRLDNRLRLININVDFILKTRSDNPKIRKCFEKFQPFCILSESIKDGIPISCDLKITD